MADINSIRIPYSIFTSDLYKPSPFIPKEENINPGAVKEITKENYDSSDEQKYSDGIITWFNENMEVKLKYEEISGDYGIEEPILEIFELDLSNKGKDGYYIITEKMENFECDQKFEEIGDYIYINVSGNKKITLSTTEDIDFSTLPIFISPALSKLGVTLPVQTCNNNGKCDVGETKENCNDCNTSMQTIWIIIGVIVIIGLVIYFILREWYKRNYESSLFKNKNDLYNMITYINNSMRQGSDDSKTRGNLKKAGWNPEQISYAMKKYKGKRTGLP
ncbi:MAG: hypothetical protein Q7R52_01880 [archaeon]|nr:hypothetical protein [archaeon]